MIYDIILIAVLLLFAWRGRKRGFIAGILGFFSVIISYIVSGVVSKPLCDMFKTTPAYEALLLKITEIIPENSTIPKNGIFDTFVAESQEIFVNHVADFVAGIVISVIVFFAVLIILKIAIKLLSSVFILPGLNFLNKTGGLILGTVTGFMIIYALLAIWGAFTLFELPEVLENSNLLRSMFEYNILFMIIS